MKSRPCTKQPWPRTVPLPPRLNLYSPSNSLNRVCVDSAHCCRLLLAANADKDAADLYGATPLMKVRRCSLWPRCVDSVLCRRLNTTCRAPLCCCWTPALPTCAIKPARLPRALLHANNTTKLLLRLPIGLKNIVNCSCFSFVFCHRYFSQQFYLKKPILKIANALTSAKSTGKHSAFGGLEAMLSRKAKIKK